MEFRRDEHGNIRIFGLTIAELATVLSILGIVALGAIGYYKIQSAVTRLTKQHPESGKAAIPHPHPENLPRSAFEIPIGSIIAWYPNAIGNPAVPDGWAACNGADERDNPDTAFDETQIPNLNGEKLFLRGSNVSGIPQSDAIKQHKHTAPSPEDIPLNRNEPAVVGSPQFLAELDNTEGQGIPVNGNSGNGGRWYRPATHTGVNADGADETRPKNMSVVWIIRVN